jgi:hypothetical protein
MECEQRARLRKIYMTASVTFDGARTLLQIQQRVGICPKREFWALWEALDRASDGLKLARAALDAHIQEHCCMVQDGTVTQA